MKCIVCLTDINLNTHMKVDVDGELYEVHLCDEHAETTAMGQVTKKVKEIKEKLRNAIELAQDLGISIPEINIKSTDKMPDMNILPESAPTMAPTVSSTAAQASTSPTNPQESPKIVREAVEVQLSDKEKIQCDTEIEMQEVELRGGKVSIPKHTVGEAGESRIKILNTSDTLIQKRAQELKQMGDSGQQIPTGYVSDCLACNGTGVHSILKKDCPKCNGTGLRT